MLKFLIAVMAVAVAAGQRGDPATHQLPDFKKKTPGPIGIMRTSSGAAINYRDARVTLNRNLLNNEYFLDTITHLVRERIPERVVHAKGAGAFGYFETTHSISHICKAKLFSKVGKRTPVAARFSPALKEKGGLDTSRDARGFAVKFYTEDGNFDIAGFNTPMYVYKDPLLFTTFVRSFKPNPANNLLDFNMFWDFLTLNPESLHMFMLIYSDRGIPDGYRHMPGFGIHTYQVINELGEIFFIRFHFEPEAGIKNLSNEQAAKIAFLDPDYATRDLYNSIGSGNYPSWRVSIQTLTVDDVNNAGFDVFDVTKILPLKRYPLHPVGRIVLNKNPLNYFAEVEQLAFCPGNLVLGIEGCPDKVFEARRFAYRDAQNHRLGVNFNNIPVNSPLRVQSYHDGGVPIQCPFQTSVLTYNRDGVSPVNGNGGDAPNYYPNSFHGPVPHLDKHDIELVHIYQDAPNNFAQAGELYTDGMTATERNNLVTNMVLSLSRVEKFIKSRAIKMLTLIHPDLGGRIAKGLSSNTTKDF